MFKNVDFGDEAQKQILEGVNMVADAVCTTLGPRGTNVIYTSANSYPNITKDGVTVAKQVFPKNKLQNMGVMMAREAAENTNRAAGDGTTSTIAILQSLVNEGYKYVSAGMNPVLLKKGMDAACDGWVALLNILAKDVKTEEDKLNIATVSANNDPELGKLIVDVVNEIGTDGVITITTSNSATTEVEYLKGTKLWGWYETPVFINNPKTLSCELEKPVIILTSDRISTQAQLVPVLDKLLKAGKREMVLFAEDVEGQALAFLIQNYIQGKFVCVPVKFPSYAGYQKDLMFDFATLIQANVLGDEQGKKTIDGDLSDYGTCEKIVITRESTLVNWGKGDVTARIEEVKTLMDWEKDHYRTEKLKERLSKLTGKAAHIKVGWASDTEQLEIKDRIEDSLNATKSAIEEGIVEWAGTALARCAKNVSLITGSPEFNAWVKIVVNAMSAPFKRIIKNWGENADAILGKVLESTDSYNSLTMEYENLIESGIIDPVKVVKNELINAVATSGILLTSSVAITAIDEEVK